MHPSCIEEEYLHQKTYAQHILAQPDHYIGNVQRQTEQMWIVENDRIVNKKIQYAPGFFKMFEEILGNALENLQRKGSSYKISYIKVKIGNTIMIENDGEPIPIQIHKEYGVYVPELIFGELLAGSHLKQRKGRNGLGAKLTNIFSTEFTVELCDGQYYFQQIWTNNMENKLLPVINSLKRDPFVRITFKPDYQRFAMKDIDDDSQALLIRRVYDVAAMYGSRIRVFLNDQQINIINFQQYIDRCLPEGAVKIYSKKMATPRWEVAVGPSLTDFQHLSFVNSIFAPKGGTHVTYVTDKIITEIYNKMRNNKRFNKVEFRKQQVKQSICVFINCLIENPTFDSKLRECVTTKVSELEDSDEEQFEINEQFSRALLRSGIIEIIIKQCQAQADSKLVQLGCMQYQIDGLEDAEEAGKENSQLCTLILTQGDAIKSFAKAGIDYVGQQYYGVYSLNNRLLNVREADNLQNIQNKQIQRLIKIMGLEPNKQYFNRQSLRYGAILLMTERDVEGSQIKGLIINFIHFFWPSLITLKGFLLEFVPHYDKSLGESTDQEAQEYFQNIRNHIKQFRYDGGKDDQTIDGFFNYKLGWQKKYWLGESIPNELLDDTNREQGYSNFILSELVYFHNLGNRRMIPSQLDGLTSGERKVLFACFKRNLTEKIKVSSLCWYIREHTGYNLGEDSLIKNIIRMASNFVGSNNINILFPKGQFGSRSMGGNDHATPKYIYTSLNRITRYIYPEYDDHIIKYQEENNQMVEPQYYIPIIPMCLINGAGGGVADWKTNPMNYDPILLVKLLKLRMEGQKFEDFEDFLPYYKKFDGSIERLPDGRYITRGLIECNNETDIVTIKELPIKSWTQNYKRWLDTIMAQEDSKILDIREYHSKEKVHFEIQMEKGFVRDLQNPIKYFKLESPPTRQEIALFNSDNRIQIYHNVAELMEEFFQVRLFYYYKRKEYLISTWNREALILRNQCAFLERIITGKIVIENQKKIALIQQLGQLGFPKLPKSDKIQAFGNFDEDQNIEGSSDEDESDFGYSYLLSMPLISLTFQKVKNIQLKLASKEEEIEVLVKKSVYQLWQEDLEKFENAYDQI